MIAAAAAKVPSTPVEWGAIAPEIALAAAGIAIVLVTALRRRRPGTYEASFALALAGIVGAAVALATQWNDLRHHGAYQALGNMVAVDGFGVFLGVVVVIATLMALLLSGHYVRREGFDATEYLALLMFSATGMVIMTAANDLITVFLALEVLSIPLYVLAAFDRKRLTSLEAGLKYFVLGAFSSGVLLYGIALVYGATGTTSLPGIAIFLSSNAVLHDGVLMGGIVLVLAGLGFKVAAVPFHMWTPDVYDGAPTPITAFMASATKAAGFAALLRVFMSAFNVYQLDWKPAVIALSILSILVGAIAAVVQTDIKRMLAYSSINHAGYVLIGLAAATAAGVAASLFYLFTYTFMIVGSFGVVALIARRGDRDHTLTGYRGLAKREPVLAGALAFFLLAQAGVPFTGGFVAKLAVFSAGIDARQYGLVIVGVLAAVISAFFYLRVVVLMFMSGEEELEPDGAPGATARPVATRVRIDFGSGLVLAGAVALVVVLGFFPGFALHFAKDATLLFT